MTASSLRTGDLSEIFRSAEHSPEEFRIGAESEKFGVERSSGRPLGYGGDFSVCQVLTHLEKNHGWSPIREVEDGPVLGLTRAGASITLEPSAQLELSGAPLSDLHAVYDEAREHLEELRPVSEEMGLAWLTVGFHPLRRLDELPWVPKQRYPIMREYLPQKGSGGLDMMQRTATVQGNFDWSSEDDGMRKLRVALKLSPLLQAWFSNAPFYEGAPSSTLSHRGHVWRKMDPSRSGLIERLWSKGATSYDDYTEWAMDSGMFLFRREGEIVKNTGQPFRDFLKNGYQGHTARLEDWKLHLTTLFPEVRMKNTLEVRSVDGVPPDLALASLGLWTGILYDDEALRAVEELLEGWSFAEMESRRVELCERALHAELFGESAFVWAERVLALAEKGLKRRSRKRSDGQSEAVYLEPARAIVESRQVPADELLRRFEDSKSVIAACELQLS